MIIKYADILVLCVVSGVIIASYDTTDLHEIYVFAGVSALSAWLFCMILNGAPARWGGIMRNRFVLLGMAAYGSLIAFLGVGGIIPILGMELYGMIPMVIAVNAAVFRVLVPMYILLAGKFGRIRLLNV